jgi:hypothetical protein
MTPIVNTAAKNHFVVLIQNAPLGQKAVCSEPQRLNRDVIMKTILEAVKEGGDLVVFHSV